MEFRYALPEGEVTVQVDPTERGYAIVILRPGRESAAYHVDARQPEHGRLTLCFDDRRVRVYVASDGRARYVSLGGNSWRLEPPKPRGRAATDAAGDLSASMPGKVLDVLVSEGQEVQAGTPLVLLEAMKMELRITAPTDGRVKRVRVRPGDVVGLGEALVELE